MSFSENRYPLFDRAVTMPSIDFEEHIAGAAASGAGTVIAFAGGPQHTYQWGRVLARMQIPHVLMRDTTQNYHSKGVAGIGGREDVVRYIRRLYARGRVTTVGVSSGAYAALLYGQLAPVDDVLVISPLTGRDVDDFPAEYHSQIVDPAQPEMDDLRKYFARGPIPRVRAFISDKHPTCTLDRQMCTRIGLTDIEVIPGHEHGELARWMRDNGVLQRELLR